MKIMIDSSKDILYIVISFCVIWATVFLCWMMFYVGKILKNVSRIIEEFRLRLHQISEIVNKVHGRVETMSSILSKIFTGKKIGYDSLRNVMSDKADDILDGGTDVAKAVAREAVQKAVEKTAKKIKKIAKKMR